MSKFKIIKAIDAGTGALSDANGNSVTMQSLAPKVGDIIEGEVKSNTVFGKEVSGIWFKVDAGGGTDVGEGEIYIPTDSVQKITVVDNAIDTAKSLNPLYTILAIAAAVGLFFALNHKKS